NVLSYGRQGLFAHDNTHHALAMAYAAVDSLGPAGFDRTRWAAHRRVFETHVVGIDVGDSGPAISDLLDGVRPALRDRFRAGALSRREHRRRPRVPARSVLRAARRHLSEPARGEGSGRPPRGEPGDLDARRDSLCADEARGRLGREPGAR